MKAGETMRRLKRGYGDVLVALKAKANLDRAIRNGKFIARDAEAVQDAGPNNRPITRGTARLVVQTRQVGTAESGIGFGNRI